MQTLEPRLKRGLYGFVAAVLFASGILVVAIQHASAAQVTSRSITISKSAAGASNVVYKVSFTTATTGNVGGLVVDFCSNDPIIGDACTAPTSFDINKSTTTIANQTGITGFSIDTTNSTANKLILTRTASSITAPQATVVELGNGTSNGFHNPSTVGSFYARIYTYATSAAAQGHNQNSPSWYVDYGGIALSTAAVINITAKVQETLTFCVYPTTGVCGDDPSFTIGHAVGTATVIESSAVDTATANFSIATNANGGAVIRMKGDTLKSGANSIAAAGAGSGSGVAFVAGTEKFGLRVSTSGTNIVATAPYSHATQYALVTSGAGTDDVTSTYGGQIAALTAPVNSSVSTVTFAATASNTTPAGTYTAAEQFTAGGTF